MSLTTTEAALLGLLLKGPMSGYDLLKDAERSVGYFWTPAKTQVYATLPKLVRAGYATEERIVQETRPDKRLYALTDEGRRALREWLDEPPGNRDLLLLKVYFGAEADSEALRRQLAERREDAERLGAELEALDAEPGAQDDPFQTLTRRYGLLYAAAVRQWAEEAERELERLAPANRAAR